jgi:hypothetical protein
MNVRKRLSHILYCFACHTQAAAQQANNYAHLKIIGRIVLLRLGNCEIDAKGDAKGDRSEFLDDGDNL